MVQVDVVLVALQVVTFDETLYPLLQVGRLMERERR